MTPPPLLTRPFTAADTEAVIALWQACGLTRPWNDPHTDIAARMTINDDLFLVGHIQGSAAGSSLVACAMGGYDGHRGWVYYVGSHPEHRGGGYARLMMSELEHRLRDKGCPKINLQVRDDNLQALAFYEHLGYTVDNVVGLGKRLDSEA